MEVKGGLLLREGLKAGRINAAALRAALHSALAHLQLCLTIPYPGQA